MRADLKMQKNDVIIQEIWKFCSFLKNRLSKGPSIHDEEFAEEHYFITVENVFLRRVIFI